MPVFDVGHFGVVKKYALVKKQFYHFTFYSGTPLIKHMKFMSTVV